MKTGTFGFAVMDVLVSEAFHLKAFQSPSSEQIKIAYELTFI